MARYSSSRVLSHQAVRLARGGQGAPGAGASVTELVALLSGDRPSDVCPVLRGFLRTYDEAVDDRRRRDLYRCAAGVIGTRSSREVTAARARRALDWGRAVHARGRGLRGWLARRPAAPEPAGEEDAEGAGAYAAYAACGDDADAHARALLFLDELIAMGDGASMHLLPLRFDVADVVPAPEPVDKPAVGAAG